MMTQTMITTELTAAGVEIIIMLRVIVTMVVFIVVIKAKLMIYANFHIYKLLLLYIKC